MSQVNGLSRAFTQFDQERAPVFVFGLVRARLKKLDSNADQALTLISRW